jgi:hypothetical protein
MSAQGTTLADDAAAEVTETIEQGADQLEVFRQAVVQSARDQPFLTVAAAAGIGVVLGGGIPNWALKLAGNAAAKAAVGYAVAKAAPVGE